MEFFEIIGLAVFLYYLVSVLLWIVCDANVELIFKERFGRSVASLRGQVVWITGASSGIGKSLALSLAKNGVKLVLSARRENELHDVREQCLSVSGGLLGNDDILVLPMDMLNYNSHEKCLKSIVDHFGTIHILVNNAGRSQRAKWEKIDIKVDHDLFDLDVFSVVHLSRLVVRYFKEHNNSKGHLAVTSSASALVPVPFSPSYSAAKSAIHGYFHSLHVEYPNFDVTLFCPGPIATDFLQEAFTEKPEEKFGQNTKMDHRRMTAERCGDLFAVALANKLQVSWAGRFPVTLLIYIVQFYPNIAKIIWKILGTSRIKKIREGK